jgi:hypothetical protein
MVRGHWRLVEPNPEPYGHVAQGGHARLAGMVFGGPGYDLMANPKPPSFAENLAGNWMPVTIDRHNVRMWGLTDTMGRPADEPGQTSYGFLENLQQQEAAKMGLHPAQYQSSGWVGSAGLTNMTSPPDPMLRIFENRLEKTAEEKGISKPAALKQFIRGRLRLSMMEGQPQEEAGGTA